MVFGLLDIQSFYYAFKRFLVDLNHYTLCMIQVKSRREHREHHRSILLRAQVAEKESRLAAERRVKSEQEALKAKRRQEEALVRLEMVKIRKQLKEKQEREK